LDATVPCVSELAPESFCQIDGEGAAFASSKLADRSAIDTLRARRNWGFFISCPLSYLYILVYAKPIPFQFSHELSTTNKLAQFPFFKTFPSLLEAASIGSYALHALLYIPVISDACC
jgi:hypothetical protein